MIDMRHQRHANFVSNLQGHIQRSGALVARRMPTDADLYADDDVAVFGRDGGGFFRRHQANILALPDHDRLGKPEDAGKRDVQVGEDARFAAFDDVAAEARKIARTGAAGIDRGGDTRRAAKIVGINTQGRAAPIDVGVQIDEAGCDDIAFDVAHLRVSPGFKGFCNAGRLAADETDIHHAVDVLGWVDDMATAQDQIVGHFIFPNSHAPYFAAAEPRLVSIIAAAVKFSGWASIPNKVLDPDRRVAKAPVSLLVDEFISFRRGKRVRDWPASDPETQGRE